MSSERSEFLIWQSGIYFFGLELIHCREIVPDQSITRLPRAPEFVCGLANLRGTVVSVLDLEALLGYRKHRQHRESSPEAVEKTARRQEVETERSLKQQSDLVRQGAWRCASSSHGESRSLTRLGERLQRARGFSISCPIILLRRTGHPIAVSADSVRGTVFLGAGELEPVPANLTEAESTLIRCVARTKDGLILVPDVDVLAAKIY